MHACVHASMHMSRSESQSSLVTLCIPIWVLGSNSGYLASWQAPWLAEPSHQPKMFFSPLPLPFAFPFSAPLLFLIHMCVGGEHVEVRVVVDLPEGQFWGSNAGYQNWEQTPLLTDLYCQSPLDFFKNYVYVLWLWFRMLLILALSGHKWISEFEASLLPHEFKTSRAT